MKLKTRLIIAFLTVILIPVVLTSVIVFVLGTHQIHSIEKNYELKGTTVKSLSNSIETMSALTEKPFRELSQVAEEEPARLEESSYLEQWNRRLQKKKSFLLATREGEVIYVGSGKKQVDAILSQLPEYGEASEASQNGIYLGGKEQVLLKQIDVTYEDGQKGSLFLVTDMKDMIPEIETFLVRMVYGVMIVLILTAAVLIYWIYRGVMRPLAKMQVAAKNITEGNLDFELKQESKDELGSLCRDLEAMRKRLKDTTEERLKFDQENKELISNISHDLKTPVTTIKGYAEGILDGVADTPEKVDKYVKTIYNKANEMDLLINELTFYTKIDTNRIPYNFSTISVNGYFNDCAEDLAMELEPAGIEFGYFNYVEEDVKVIADTEQIKRVVHNIVNNSIKYMDKKKGKINLRIKDVGDFVQIELEDNGKGIAAKDLPNIFDRFFRSDTSRNSSKGGSGIGLSIVKKIIEEHGGKIWATSRENTGTTMYFVLRKYQEVPIHE